ncbi:MAG TPA: hypothetical protein VMD07_09250 [Candidatus Acidoferrales bacterium]|nr:hypothetical protein [Candidatus Acidoferrales bacterium]
MAEQTKTNDKEQPKKDAAKPLDSKELDKVSGGVSKGPDFVKGGPNTATHNP